MSTTLFETETAKLTSLRLELDGIERQISAAKPATTLRERIERAAAERLGRDVGEPDGRADLQHERKVLTEAIRQQEAAVKTLQAEHAREVCAKQRTEHCELIRAAVENLIRAANALDEQTLLIEKLEFSGMSTSGHLRHVLVPGVTFLGGDSHATVFLRECLSFNFCTIKELRGWNCPADVLARLEMFK